MGKKSIGQAISKAADKYHSTKVMEQEEKAEAETLSGRRKIECEHCGKVDTLKAVCSHDGGFLYIGYCGKRLCSECAKKCKKCGKYFCPKHINKHKCK